MIVTLDVIVDCTGTRPQVHDLFITTLKELVTKYPGALRKAPDISPYYEMLEGQKDIVILHLPVLDTELDRMKFAVGPIWRRLAYAQRLLPEKTTQKMREMGELPTEPA